MSDPFLPEGSSCGGDCEARIYRNELDGRGDREVILKPLVVNKHHARFIWNDTKRSFVFDHSDSDVLLADIDAIANSQEPTSGTRIGGSVFFSELKGFVGGGYEVFLKYNLKKLNEIAKGRNAQRKNWLRRFLDDCDNVPEKKILLRVLEQS